MVVKYLPLVFSQSFLVHQSVKTIKNMYEVKNKVVMVTGGASGIGAEVVRNFADAGAKHVAILDQAQEAGTNLQNDLNSKYGANITKYYNVDVTDDDQLFGAFLFEEHGYIDVVVNCAGIMNDSPDVYKKQIEVNVTALVTSTLKAYELMRKDKGGRGGTVINIASTAGLTQAPFMPIYWATKSAVIQFSNCIGHADHYSKADVRVVVICFGMTTTPLLKNLVSFDNDPINVDSLKTTAGQSPQTAARGLMEVYKTGSSGSTWVIASGKPATDITQTTR